MFQFEGAFFIYSTGQAISWGDVCLPRKSLNIFEDQNFNDKITEVSLETNNCLRNKIWNQMDSFQKYYLVDRII